MTEAVQISSRDNALLVRLRRLARAPGAYRKLGAVWLEGAHLCQALRARGRAAAHALVSDSVRAIVLDVVLLLTRNWTITAVIGAWLFAALFYPTNWAIFAYSHTPVVIDGTLLSWADYMGFAYVRTGTPEYIRMIEVGSPTPPGSPGHRQQQVAAVEKLERLDERLEVLPRLERRHGGRVHDLLSGPGLRRAVRRAPGQ